MEMSALIKADLAATCNTLGRKNKAGEYIVDPQCFESVRELIRFLRRDDSFHQVRLYLGDAKVLQNDLVPIATISADKNELFDVTIRLLVNLTNPVILLYKEEVPVEKTGRNIYMRLMRYSQEYKEVFCNVEFWKAVMGKLQFLFEIDWSERSEDSSLQIERLLVLLRNVLQVPADSELEQRPDNDITIHDKILWSLRESQLLELLLYVSSNRDEQKYFLHLLEIFSLVLREQSPLLLAHCEIRRSVVEKERDSRELCELREREKHSSKSFKNMRSFHQTFVLKNVKSISDNEVVYHKSLDKLNDLQLTQEKKRIKTPKNWFPEDSERAERRSTFSVRLFLKEFCMELLSCSFNHLMGIVKDKLLSGKGLANDESYYFWALKFFLEFACNANVDVKLFSECINVQTFHFVQTQMENCYDNLAADKKKMNIWVRRLHLTLKAYRALLHTLGWMDASKDAKIRDMSRVLKSNLFYVPEYRELMISCLLKYDSRKYPLSFLRDLIETNHLNLKLLENYCKSSKIVVQRKKRVVKKRAKKKPKEEPEPPEMKWEKIKDSVHDVIEKNSDIPEIVPFDATLPISIDDQKADAMKNIQRKLRDGLVKEAVGLLRSSRQVWPENDCFGSFGMPVEEEVKTLQEICITDLGIVYQDNTCDNEESEEEEEEEHRDEERSAFVEENYDIEDYVKRLVNKKVVEGACLLLSNYKRNSDNTNHCVVKLLHRIGWQCKAPAMMYQASFFITLNRILNEKNPAFKEIQQFAKQLFKKFRENAATNPKIFMELLFWKDPKIAIEIENGYGINEEKKHKSAWSEEEEDEIKMLWVEFDEKMLSGDKIDWIKNNLINQNRSRIGIIKKLKELMLIAPGTRGPRKRGGAPWSEDETKLLAQLFEQHKEAIDVVGMIRDRMMARSKKSIRDKLLDLGLVSSLADLRKRKPKKNKNRASDDELFPIHESSSDSSSDENEPASHFSSYEAAVALKKVENMTEALVWLKETLTECIEDDENSTGYPLLALNSAHNEALQNGDFQEALKKINFCEPSDSEMYWRVSGNKMELHEVLELINIALDGKIDEVYGSKSIGKRRSSTSDDSEDDFEKLRRVLPRKKEKSPAKESRNNSPITVPSTVRLDPKPRVLDSDRSDEGGVSEKDSPEKNEKQPTSSITHDIDSDRSGVGDGSDEDVVRHLPPRRKVERVASDSDEEQPKLPYWRQKRRRCIGSDSEVEDIASDEEMKHAPVEVRKKSRLLDSDSEVEGHNSAEDVMDKTN